MKHNIRKFAAALAVVVMLLSACGGPEEQPPQQQPGVEPVCLTVAVGDLPDTLMPGECTAVGSETVLYHLYENLLRWEDNGFGFAVLVPGQAESYTVETDYTGVTTYTFTLRDDIYWSDGQAVTAHNFVSAWQKLADPASNSPHSELLRCVSGYDAVQESGDTSLLGVSAPDNRTFVVTLTSSAPYFLKDVCAGAYTMPVRTYLPGNEKDQFVTNGAYTVGEFSAERITIVKNEKFYDAANVTVDELCFVPSQGGEADYGKLQDGSLDLVVELPASAVETLAQNERWKPEAVTSTYGFVFNTRLAPFDNSAVRSAFRLVIDEQAIIDALNVRTLRPATGLVPYGVTGYSEQNPEDESGNASGDSSGKPPLIDTSVFWDFRTHSEEIVTLDTSEDYAADCTRARELLASAGYAGGVGFPETEYIFIDTPENKAVAEILQAVWKKELGITIVLRPVTSEEYAVMTGSAENSEGAASPTFQIAAMEFTPAEEYNDAGAFLYRWHSAAEDNIAGYSSAAFDILLSAARAAVAAETYDAYMHDAEAILLEDAPVVALFYRGSSYALADDLTGLYRAPNGLYFFYNVTRKN